MEESTSEQLPQKQNKTLSRVALIAIVVLLGLLLLPRYFRGPYLPSLIGGRAPDGNWSSSQWASSNNTMLGTAASQNSKVWFTGSRGIVTTVFYPSADMPNSSDLEFLVGDSLHTWVDEEQQDTEAKTQLYDPHALAWTTINTAKNHKYQIKKVIYTDPLSDSLVQQVTFTVLKGTLADYLLYIYYDPTIHDSGDKNSSFTRTFNNTTMLVSTDASGDYASALAASIPYQQTSSGFVNFNDGLTDLKGHINCGSDKCPDYKMNYVYDSALRGNTAQTGLLDLTDDNEINTLAATSITFKTVLSFGQFTGAFHAVPSAEEALDATLNDASNQLQSYVQQWHRFDDNLTPPPAVGSTRAIQQARQQEYYLAMNVLKASQDKETGAFVAGLGNPWGDSKGDEDTDGYHIVRARDMYHIASALILAGDTADPARGLRWAFDKQQQLDGHFPQTSDTNGDPHWTAIQMDQQAFPIMLAWKLGLTDIETYQKNIKAAADYIVDHGPTTQQDRWGENGGYSPATIADEISGLLCAADIARINGDSASQKRYTDTADTYQHSVIQWTYTTTGPLEGGHYFERIDDTGNPNEIGQLSLSNHSGTYDKRTIVDMSFLELVRQGVLSAKAPEITSSLDVVDASISETVNGHTYWYRYNHDGYGEHDDGTNYDDTGHGQLWPLLSGERGMYTIAAGDDADPYLTAMLAASNSSGLIPEQIWSNEAPTGYVPGEATKSMNPLNWTISEYVTLLFSASQHKLADSIPLVYDRYVAHTTNTEKKSNGQSQGTPNSPSDTPTPSPSPTS